MANEIEIPREPEARIASVGEFLKLCDEWQSEQAQGETAGMFSNLWYRGVNKGYPSQLPGVYRPGFEERAKRQSGKELEAQRAELERAMLRQFRVVAASFLRTSNLVEIYFIARHYGMPTRLLDWTANPLAALFFACDGGPEHNGHIYAMDARAMVPPEAEQHGLKQNVLTMRHPYVRYAVRLAFGGKSNTRRPPYILPIRPDHVNSRIGLQNSCFTLHMHGAASYCNPTLRVFEIETSAKAAVLRQLRQLNINRFTIYNDLDNLAREIRFAWGIEGES